MPMAGDCPAASVLLAFAEATISAPFSRARPSDARCRRQCILRVCFAAEPCAAALRRARAAPARGPPARVAGEGSGGRDAPPDPSRSGGRGRCRRGPAKRCRQEAARKLGEFAKVRPSHLPARRGRARLDRSGPFPAASVLDARGSARRESGCDIKDFHFPPSDPLRGGSRDGRAGPGRGAGVGVGVES